MGFPWNGIPMGFPTPMHTSNIYCVTQVGDEDLPAATPTQTSFIQRRLQKQRDDERRREEADRKRQAEIRAAKERADDISLKESIAKVKSWKQQLRGASPPEDDVADSIFGKDDWRKRKTLARGPSTDDATTTTKTQKKFAGVAGFPPVDAVADDTRQSDSTSRLGAPAPASRRALSPYDNLKPPRHPQSNTTDRAQV